MTARTTSDGRSSLGRGLRRGLLWGLGGLLAVIAVLWGYNRLDRHIKDYDVVITPTSIPADGVSSALMEIRLISRFGNQLNTRVLPMPPKVEIVEGADLVRVLMLDSLHYRLIARFQTGSVLARVRIWGAPGPIEARLELTASLADRNRNGYPDAMDLSSIGDRMAFRQWFVAIAKSQMTQMDDRWHDRDCAGLLRYCYREALKRHDNAWLRGRRWLATVGIRDVAKYNYPTVPLVGTNVFNVGEEPAHAVTATDAGGAIAGNMPSVPKRRRGPLSRFAAFGEAARLKDNSLVYVSRSPADAIPGDVLFYLNDTDAEWPYHSMIYIGDWATIYHTGPDNGKPGIVKRMTLQDLAAHPNPRWHPVPSNPYFLGFYRWRILVG